MDQPAEHHEFIGKRRGDVAEEPQHVPGLAERVGDDAAGDHRSDRMQAIFERSPPRRNCRHPRAAPRTGPRCHRLLAVRALPSASTRSTESRLSSASACFPISQPSPPPSVRPPMPVVETTPPVVARPCSCVSRLNWPHVEPPCARRFGLRIDVNAGHRRQVDHQAAVDRRAPRDVVTAAANRDFELLLARQLDRVDDVGSRRGNARSAPAACRSGHYGSSWPDRSPGWSPAGAAP